MDTAIAGINTTNAYIPPNSPMPASAVLFHWIRRIFLKQQDTSS